MGFACVLERDAPRKSYFSSRTNSGFGAARAAVFAFRLAGLFAAAVYLLKEMAEHADEPAAQGAEQEQQRQGAPERAVGGQAGLKRGRHQGHARGDEREEE